MDANGWESFIRLKSNKETVLDAIFVSLRTKESTECLISMMTSVDEDNRIIKGIQHFISVDSSRYQREPSEIIDEIQSYRRFVRAIETESRLCSETISRRINERRRSYIRYLKRSADDMLESMRKDDSYIPVYEFEDLRNLDTDRLLCLISQQGQQVKDLFTQLDGNGFRQDFFRKPLWSFIDKVYINPRSRSQGSSFPEE